ncbi:hypothetical protein B0O80DRAFT_426364 [Mortierella sp. GBAus27b]|nr:hypothetical protein B0O80DRAFT_426364 [Mortierella sp. GBAus27b]
MRDIGQEHNRESEGERGGLVPEPAPSYKGVGLAKCVHCQLSSGDKSRVHGAASPHPSTAQPSTPPTNQLHSLSSFSKTMARTQNKRKSNQTNLPGRDERLSYGQKGCSRCWLSPDFLLLIGKESQKAAAAKSLKIGCRPRDAPDLDDRAATALHFALTSPMSTLSNPIAPQLIG